MAKKNETKADGTLTKEALDAAEAELMEAKEAGEKGVIDDFNDDVFGDPFMVQTCEFVNPAGAPDVTVCILVGRDGRVLVGMSDEGTKMAQESAVASA